MSAPSTPQSNKRRSTFHDDFPANSSKTLHPSDIANDSDVPMISAMFLVKFDVHSGYTIEWSDRDSDEISLKGIEFKCLPSGLHSIETDLIYFIQPKKMIITNDPFSNLLYGVSVYKQNLQDDVRSRADVKMYSLGILMDPETNLTLANTSFPKNLISKYLPTWRPINYTSGWEYIDDLTALLDDFMAQDDMTNFDLFKTFFKNRKIHQDINIKQLKRQSLQSVSSSQSRTSQHIPASLENNHHMLLALMPLAESLGPLIFPIWKSALLRERILIFDAESVELGCSFSYIISILSTLPQEILPILGESGCNAKYLQYIQPLYNIGINDINWLNALSKKCVEFNGVPPGFIAYSTDEILLYKTQLYDLALQFPNSPLNNSSYPRLLRSESLKPGSAEKCVKATVKDLRKLKLLNSEYDLFDFEKLANDNFKVTDNLVEFEWWRDVTSPLSWREYTWNGFFFWASAGESARLSEDIEHDNFNSNSLNSSIIKNFPTDYLKILNIVGYFQNLTIRVFKVLAELVNNENGSIQSQQRQPQRNSADDVELETEEDDDDYEVDSALLQGNPIYIEFGDMEEMGLDPYSHEDYQFVIELVRLYWDKEAKVGSRFGNICC